MVAQTRKLLTANKLHHPKRVYKQTLIQEENMKIGILFNLKYTIKPLS